MNDEIQFIPIEQIRIFNPRHQDRRKFESIMKSINSDGQAKLIQVKQCSKGKVKKPAYELVDGHSRLEAWIALGHKTIPAVIKPRRGRSHER